MPVSEGTFRLYSFIEPPLEAGDYRFRATQDLRASGSTGTLGPGELPVATSDTHVRIRSPRYQLPPGEVLSTFPAATSEGAYGNRLPQVVIRRRTLPWERDLAGQPRTTPWLALVLVAEGEAELKANQPVAECVTPGVTLPGVADVERGTYLEVRQSMIERIFPTRKDVPLLAHAREVDINDTELMMGDDDGFLAVVIANRLPLAGTDAGGAEVPTKYLACLVNLEEQFDRLLPESPPRATATAVPFFAATVALDVAAWDKASMGRDVAAGLLARDTVPGPLEDPAVAGPVADAPRAVSPTTVARTTAGAAAQSMPFRRAQQWSLADAEAAAPDVYLEMARDFSVSHRFDRTVTLDPVRRFPVLLHWSFVSTGATTFRRLMEDLGSGLLGTVGGEDREPPAGRAPVEVVETGHVGLVHRGRRGDEVRAWYRGPFVPHPTEDPPEGRLALAHAADQLRVVVPDGREDLSLAAAFEIGRLLALSRPAMVAALLRWRQEQYQVARRRTVWAGPRSVLDGLVAGGIAGMLDQDLGVTLGRAVVGRLVEDPLTFLGPPREQLDPGRPLDLDGAAGAVLGAGLGLDPKVLAGDSGQVLDRLRGRDVPVVSVLDDRQLGVLTGATLRRTLDQGLVDLVSDTLAPHLLERPFAGPGVPRTQRRSGRVADRLDELIVTDTDTDTTEGGGPR